MANLIVSFTCLVFGMIAIVFLRYIIIGHSVAAIFKNSFFWLSMASLTALLAYAVYTPNIAQARAVELDNGELVLSSSNIPSAGDAWKNLETEFEIRYRNTDYAIYAEDLRDPTRKISINADLEMPSASIYKLAVAYSMLSSVASGTSWKSPVWNTTLVECFDKMIIESNNECAHAWGNKHGWQAIMDEFADLGLYINLYEPTSTTAGDIAEFLKKAYYRQILNDELIDKLFDAMKSQRFRRGIPAELTNKTVANKVGFMDDILNDAGIVFGPDGDYVLVVFTDNHSWESIATTARLIDENY